MKKLLIGICLLSTIIITGCSNQEKKEAEATRSYKAENGTIQVPSDPKRIVAISFLGDLAAIGVKPVGAGSLALENSVLLEKELAGVVNVGDIDAEKVLSLDPDLIIIPSYFPAETIEQMEKIAPTAAIKWGGFENIDPMEQVKTIANLLGKEKEATSFIEGYQKKADIAKAEIAKYIPANESVGSYSIWAKNFWVWPELRDASYNLFTTFGYKAPAKIQKDVFDAKSSGLDISLEVLDEYAADHMFVSVYSPDGGKEKAEEVMKSALWKGLSAVKNNHVYFLDYKKFWMTDGLNLERQLDIIVDLVKTQNTK